MITEARANAQAIIESIRPQTTGIISGGILSINVADHTKFDLTAGFGVIVNNETDPQHPTITPVAWGNMVGVVDPYRTLSLSTKIAIDSTGTLVFGTDDFTDVQRRSLIVIGWNDHQDKTEIDTSQTEPFYVCGAITQLNDFIEAFGAFNMQGNEYAAATGLAVQRTAGKVFDGNSNYFRDKRDPHVTATGAENPVEIIYYQRDGSGGWIDDNDPVAVVDPNHWDNGSVSLQAVPAGKFTIQLISFYAPYQSNDFQYGQALYDTMDDAESAIRKAVIVDPFNIFDVFRSWLIVKQGTTSLANASDAKFISAGKLGMIDVASGGGVGGEINTASSAGLIGVGITMPKLGVDLPFKSVAANSNKVAVTDDAVNHAVKVDVVPANISHTAFADIGTNSHATIDSDLPTADQKQALVGTYGTPNASNKYVTSFDPRNSDSRTPTIHAASHLPGGSDPLPIIQYLATTETKELPGHPGDFYPFEELGIRCKVDKLYKFAFYFRVRVDDVSEGIQFQFATMDGELSASAGYALRTTSETHRPIVEFATPVIFLTSAYGPHNVNLFRVEGIVRCTSDSTLTPMLAVVLGSFPVNVEFGSIVEFREYDAKR